MSEQISRSDLDFDVPVAIGETLPPYSERGTVCGIPGLIGFALYDTCAKANPELPKPIANGVEYAASMMIESDRSDWTYIAIGGQTSLQKLIRDYPDAISKIENLVVMGGNWCTGFDAYPDVPTPTAETNIGCDMAAANFVLEAAANAKHAGQYFPAIQYVPIVTVNVLSGDDYALITDAASHSNNNPYYNQAAHATIDFYNAWSANARANKALLIHKEAMTFDPSYESTPQFDAVAVLVAMDIVRGASSARVAQHEFANGVHFVTNQEYEVAENHPEFFRGKPAPAAYSLWSGSEASLDDKLKQNNPISGRCAGLTPYQYDPKMVPPSLSNKTGVQSPPAAPVAIQAALGFHSKESEKDFFHEMALRISGRFTPSAPTKSMTMATSVDLDACKFEQNASVAAANAAATTLPQVTAQSSQHSRLGVEECSVVA